jgi:tRNA modification GTPase
MSYVIEDTIAAVSTPLGRGGLGVIRLSGSTAVAVADRIFTSTAHKSLQQAASHTLHHGWIRRDDCSIVDEVMAAVMRAPRSYTGEDVVEFSAHGGPVVLSQILHLCLSNGARHSRPGEFTFRAFVNGKMDLARAEAVADVINAKTSSAAQAALNRLQGKLSEKVNAWRSKLVELIAALEAALDYAEEDIRFLSDVELADSLATLHADIEALRATADKGRLLQEGLKVAIIGKPNAGKSSLLNALLERERAIVTDIPGTTRDLLEEALDCGGVPLVIIDTAGLREHTTDPVEKIGHERTKAAIDNADLVLWLLDASVALSSEDRYIAELLSQRSCSTKTFLVLNKTDLGNCLPDDLLPALFAAPGATVAISARQRTGLPALEQAILSFAGTGLSTIEDPLVVNVRHRAALDRTAQALAEALTALKQNATEEIIAFHAHEAANALAEITGAITTDEILQSIFSKFCVGK